MGVFKKFIGGIACECVQAGLSSEGSKVSTIKFKDTSGTNHNVFRYGSGTAINNLTEVLSYSPYANLTPVATNNDISDYDLFDYSASAIASVSTSKSSIRGETSARLSYTIGISNAGESDVIVKCIKFIKSIYCRDLSYTPDNVLICAYYLDAPLTIPAGESRTITIEMKVGTDVSVNET